MATEKRKLSDEMLEFIDAMNKVGGDNANAYMLIKHYQNIEELIKYSPEYGVFVIEKIKIRKDEPSKGLYMSESYEGEKAKKYHDFLVNSGFAIQRYDIDDTGSTIQLSDEGRKLKRAGGFKSYYAEIDGEAARIEAEKSRVEWQQRATLVLTAILAVGTIPPGIYYVVELIKNDNQVYSVGVLTIAFVSLFSAVAVIIIYQLIKRQ